MMGAVEEATWIWEIAVDANMKAASPPQVEDGQLVKTETRGNVVTYTFQMTGPRAQ